MNQRKVKIDIPKASKLGFKPRPLLNKKLTTAIIILVILFGVSYLFSSIVSSTSSIKAGNVAVIKVRNVLTVDGKSDPFSESASSDDLITLIEAAENNPGVEAILFDINSPGGSAVASDEVQAKIKKVNKTTVALIRDIAASGAYWIASASDVVVANRFSIAGSIGVYGSYIGFEEFLERYNMSYRRFVAGEYKDLGSPLKEITSKESQILQGILDEFHAEFVKSVAENRNLTDSQISRIRTAEIFTGAKAKEVGLVDVLGSEDKALEIIEEKLNITAEPVVYAKEKTFWQKMQGLFYPGEISLKADVNPGFGVKA